MTKPPAADSRTALPSVDRVLREPGVAALVQAYGRQSAVECVRAVLADMREAKVAPNGADIAEHCRQRLEAEMRPSQRRVFNLTGTVLHTNLGRAPLPEEAVAATAESLRGPTNLEFDLDSGGRGDRTDHVRGWLKRLTGAEAATVVNNNAAAVFLVLNTLAARKEVPVSRGELIEIGGAFRMPDIMARAGCKLVEVGTTNRTHLADFANAISARTALIMKVHPSNYAIEGFTSAVGEAELAALAHKHNLPFAIDLGSGTLVDLAAYGLPHEPTPMEALKAGADLVTFSGDKLLGGPQAGVIVGKREVIERIKTNPLKRALRCDKLTLAAMAATLRIYLRSGDLVQSIPVLRLLTRSVKELEVVANRARELLMERLGEGFSIVVAPSTSEIGSGAMPGAEIETRVLRVTHPAYTPEAVAAIFRGAEPAIVGRISDGAFQLDLRTVEDPAGLAASFPPH